MKKRKLMVLNELPPYPELSEAQEQTLVSNFSKDFEAKRVARDSENKFKSDERQVRPRDYFYLVIDRVSGLQSGSQFLYRTRPENELMYALKQVQVYVERLKDLRSESRNTASIN